MNKVEFMEDIIKHKRSREESLLIESAKIASSKAVRSSIAIGITMKIIKNKWGFPNEWEYILRFTTNMNKYTL